MFDWPLMFAFKQNIDEIKLSAFRSAYDVLTNSCSHLKSIKFVVFYYNYAQNIMIIIIIYYYCYCCCYNYYYYTFVRHNPL